MRNHLNKTNVVDLMVAIDSLTSEMEEDDPLLEKFNKIDDKLIKMRDSCK